jgi:hypothetical protein
MVKSAFEQLTEKQQLFVTEYVADMDRLRAVTEAGYKGNEVSLRVMANKLLKAPKIQAAIAEVGVPMLDAARLTAENILQQLARFLWCDLAIYLDDEGCLKVPLCKLPEDVRQCIEGWEIEDVFDKKGNKIGTKTRVKPVSKAKALELAMKYRQLVTPNSVTNIQNNNTIQFDWSKFYDTPPNVIEERMTQILEGPCNSE